MKPKEGNYSLRVRKYLHILGVTFLTRIGQQREAWHMPQHELTREATSTYPRQSSWPKLFSPPDVKSSYQIC